MTSMAGLYGSILGDDRTGVFRTSGTGSAEACRTLPLPICHLIPFGQPAYKIVSIFGRILGPLNPLQQWQDEFRRPRAGIHLRHKS